MFFITSVQILLPIVFDINRRRDIPLFMAETWIKRGELAVLDTEDPEIEVQSQLFCHKGKWINPQMRAFIDFLSKP